MVTRLSPGRCGAMISCNACADALPLQAMRRPLARVRRMVARSNTFSAMMRSPCDSVFGDPLHHLDLDDHELIFAQQMADAVERLVVHHDLGRPVAVVERDERHLAAPAR